MSSLSSIPAAAAAATPTSIITTTNNKPPLLPPTLANWLSTFLLAGLQRFRGFDKESFQLLIRLTAIAPSISFPVFLMLRKQFEFTAAGILTSALVAVLFHKEEVAIMNRVIWMRVAAATWSSLSRTYVTLLTHLAITTTFYGIMLDPISSHPAIVKMSRQFLGSKFFDTYTAKLPPLPIQPSILERQTSNISSDGSDHDEKAPTLPIIEIPPGRRIRNHQQSNNNNNTDLPPFTTPLQTAIQSFIRAFKGLFIYNFILHYAAAIISRLVRTFGTKAIRGKVMVKPLDEILLRATKEALILNVGVATSCFLWVLGTTLPEKASPQTQALIGASLAPLPLWFIEPAVVDTVYFLFTPWAARYLSRNRKSYLNWLDSRARMLVGVGILLGPLRKISDEQESYAWMVSLAFSHAQRLAGRWTGF
jgi:hypothetical protein